MKLLILTNSDLGLYRFRRALIESLLAEHQVALALPEGPMVIPLVELGCEFAPLSVDRRGTNPLADGKLLLDCISLLRRCRPDLVITYTVKPNIYGGMACRLLGIPYCANITGLGTAFHKPGLLRALVTGLYRVALRKAKTVFFENSGNRDVFLNMKLCKPEQSCLLAGAGVDLEYFSLRPYPMEESPVRFLFVGRIMAEKGISELLEAVSRLVREGYGCALDLVGPAEEDHSAAMELGIRAGWLRYHGFQQEVRPFLERAHCFALPSWHEGMANTNLEAAAMGRPVITGDIPGCREAVAEGISGLLCRPRDPESLYRVMKEFLELPQERRQAMGLAGRVRMEKYFDKKQVVADTRKGLGL